MRLIDADALRGCQFKNDISYNAFVKLIDRQPTVDADIVCHGRWKVWYHGKEGGFSYTCSRCGIHADERSDYCPKCGARMDGEE